MGMTQSGEPLENAVAERAHGILKVEWLYKIAIATRDECLLSAPISMSKFNTSYERYQYTSLSSIM